MSATAGRKWRDDETAYFTDRLREAPSVLSGKSRPFALTFDLGSPVCLTTPWIAFDGLLAHLLLLDGLQDDYFITPKKLEIPFDLHNRRFLPLVKHAGGFYHGSASQFDPPASLRVSYIYKRFETAGTENLRQKRIQMGHGHYRGYILTQPYVPARRVTFYGLGDPGVVARLVGDYVYGLGNDFRIGFGAVRRWRIEETPEDWSLLRDGVAMRAIPVECCEEWEDEAYLAFRAPYWSPRNVARCVPPGGRCKLK